MIQRKQSLFLLLGAFALSILFFLDGVFGSQAAETLVWYAPALVATTAITALLAVVTIFLYENRGLQQRIVVVVQVLDLGVIVLMLVGMFLTGTLGAIGRFPQGRDVTIGLLLPALAYLFFYLARRGIQSDIELVRSMDRLR